MAVVEPFPSALSGLGPSEDCVELTPRPVVFIQRSRAYTQQEHEHFLRSVHDSIYSRNVRGDRLYKYATTETHRGGWFSAFSRQDIETGRCPRLQRPGDQGWQLPRPIGRPFSVCGGETSSGAGAHDGSTTYHLRANARGTTSQKDTSTGGSDVIIAPTSSGDRDSGYTSHRHTTAGGRLIFNAGPLRLRGLFCATSSNSWHHSGR